jgi:hypothetical protein
MGSGDRGSLALSSEGGDIGLAFRVRSDGLADERGDVDGLRQWFDGAQEARKENERKKVTGKVHGK